MTLKLVIFFLNNYFSFFNFFNKNLTPKMFARQAFPADLSIRRDRFRVIFDLLTLTDKRRA
ncbi:Uncharacterized protein dnm_021210 [Desulfonema magnum]|uniref:Uncharacterized protein n=1 Tax=Desulfonema magnum TaxID=45655 RepID=A0A975BIT5_9BACT|nr:Uncharacterized protein dnm_021210 [Desulfonema magnum]